MIFQTPQKNECTLYQGFRVDNSKYWYAVYTRSRAEKKVYEMLNYKGIDAFLPLHKTIRQWSQRRKMVEVPYIPGYCFVNICMKQYYDVLQTDNVVAFVKHCSKPAKIPDIQVEFLKKVLKYDDLPVEVSFEHYAKGTPVIITAGPFTGVKGQLVCNRGKNKFMVRIGQINCSFILEISHKELEAIFEEKVAV